MNRGGIEDFNISFTNAQLVQKKDVFFSFTKNLAHNVWIGWLRKVVKFKLRDGLRRIASSNILDRRSLSLKLMLRMLTTARLVSLCFRWSRDGIYRGHACIPVRVSPLLGRRSIHGSETNKWKRVQTDAPRQKKTKRHPANNNKQTKRYHTNSQRFIE